MFERFYCILQQEKDCGPACIATIARYYGIKISISKIRNITGTDKQGTNLLGLIKALNFLNFNVKAIKIEDFNLNQKLNFPIIAHIVNEQNFLHYIVINKVTNKYVYISDPAKGKVKYKYNDFIKLWTGILLLVEKNENFKKTIDKSSILNTFFELMRRNSKTLWYIFLASILYSIIGVISSFYFKFLVDYILKNKLIRTLNFFMIGIIIVNITNIFLVIFRNYLLQILNQKIDISILKTYYRHIIHLPLNFFLQEKVGIFYQNF